MTPWTGACQTPLSMGFSRQEYWSGLLFPSPGDLPKPGVKVGSPALQQILQCLSHEGSLQTEYCTTVKKNEETIYLRTAFSKTYFQVKKIYAIFCVKKKKAK